jgi:hypothetical protein
MKLYERWQWVTIAQAIGVREDDECAPVAENLASPGQFSAYLTRASGGGEEIEGVDLEERN